MSYPLPPIETNRLPLIIQGGMGVGVSNWRLARSVSMKGQMGVVSGTSLDSVLVRRLQDGDPGGHMRRAMSAFPIPGVAEDVLNRWYRSEGRSADSPYVALAMYRRTMPLNRQALTVLANFVEVYLAREGHSGLVGINLLTKLQMPNLASLYGAILAGVDTVIMGAGIPNEIPGSLDLLAQHKKASIKFDVEGLSSGEVEYLTFDPAEHWTDVPEPFRRPRFYPIISANSLATTLARKANGKVDGFIVEGPTAGGHNAPPRGKMTLNENGEPIYGERDIVDPVKLAELGLPFWLAGGSGSPDGLQQALSVGAQGIQVGTLFAFSNESGITDQICESVIGAVRTKSASVFTDPKASPTGYPFKVVQIEGEEDTYSKRNRVCDLGYLRTAYKMENGRIGYRCASEPVDTYVAKGGNVDDTVGRKCLCNGLFADVGLGQVREDGIEPSLVTSGDTLTEIASFLNGAISYSASQVVDYLLSGLPEEMLDSSATGEGAEPLYVGNAQAVATQDFN